MKIQQRIFIDNAIRSIQEARARLDRAMYSDIEHPMSEKEFNKVREAYEHLCKANDLL